MRTRPLILGLILISVGLLLAPQVGLTQEASLSCAPLIEQGFEQLQANCAGLENGSACFGFNTVNATGNGAFSE
ncbi:MAG: hypothetical protein L0Z53_05125, partial [Acidobacteriales bacterium]|nr:hypothetical protein [Terriglobales bacterium]